MRNRSRVVALLAALATLLGFGLLAAPSASAHGSYPTSNFWNPSQSVITVSDRSGFDLNENEAAYAWGSLSGDRISMAYTQYDTCTWCIRIVDVPAGDARAGGSMGAGRATDYVGFFGTYTSQCTVYVDTGYWSSRGDWRERQRAITHELGHCLGFDHPYYSSCASSVLVNMVCAPGPYYNPTSNDYAELAYHY